MCESAWAVFMFQTFDKKKVLITSLIVCCVFFVLSPVLRNDFVNYDDNVHLLNNPFLRPLNSENLKRLFSTTVNKTYIPLTLLSFSVEYALWGADPFVYHLNNLLFHCVNVALVVSLAWLLGLSWQVGCLAALIFGLHPMHVESVAWVTERKDVLYSFFYLIAVHCYVFHLFRVFALQKNASACCSSPGKGVSRISLKGKGWLWGTIVFGVLSAFSKPMALSLPFILLLIDWYLKRPINVYVLFEKFLCGFFLFPVIWISYSLHMRAGEMSFPQSVLIWLWCFAFHLRKFFFPDSFAVFYAPPWPVVFWNRDVLLALGIVILVICALIRFRRQRLLLLAFFWYFLSTFFLYRFDYGADSHVVADRFMYLPSLGFCYAAALFMARFVCEYNKKRSELAVAFVLIVAVFLFLSTQARKQLFVWSNSERLWRHQISWQWQGQPGLVQAVILTNYADAVLHQMGVRNLFRPYSDRGISALNKRHGISCHDRRQITQAVYLYQKALEIRPQYASASFGLARLYDLLGQGREAERHYGQAVHADPAHFDAYYYLGRILLKEKRVEESVRGFRAAIEVNPGNLLLLEQVIKEYRAALASSPHPELIEEELSRLISRSRKTR